MSHPHFHALSSVNKGYCDYDTALKIHNFYDQSKKCWAHYSHRAFLHNTYGIELSKLVFKNLNVDLDLIGKQHLEEDCPSIIPTVQDWFKNYNDLVLHNPNLYNSFSTSENNNRVEKQCSIIARKFGNVSSDYEDIVRFFNPDLNIKGIRLITNNTLGIFIAEDVFGTVFKCKSNGKLFPTRVIAEHVVRLNNLNKIPTLQELASGLVLTEKWQINNPKILDVENN